MGLKVSKMPEEREIQEMTTCCWIRVGCYCERRGRKIIVRYVRPDRRRDAGFGGQEGCEALAESGRLATFRVLGFILSYSVHL